MNKVIKFGLILAVAARLGRAVSLAQVNPISVGYSVDNGTTINLVGSNPGFFSTGFTGGDFLVTSANGTGNPPLTLPTVLQSGTTLDISPLVANPNGNGDGTSTIWVYVSETDISQPLG